MRQTRSTAALLAVSIALTTRILPGQSLDVDRRMGAEAAADVIRIQGLYGKPDLQKFLEKMGARLVDGLGPQPFTYRFAITDEIEPNAFALPGGYVFATRGIFAVADSEAELAGVLAHEIIHSDRRHSVKAKKHSILPSILAIPGGLAGIFSEEAGKVLTAPSSLAIAHYSRQNESEADKLGVKLAASAGYDPLALIQCLHRLSKVVSLMSDEKEKRSYFDDHPATAERDAAIRKTAATIERAQIPPILAGREAYLRLLDGLVVGENPEQGIFEKNVFVHPDLNFRMDLPEGWETFNTAAAFGALAVKGKGQLVIGLAEGTNDPAEAAARTLLRIDEQKHKRPVEAGRVEVNGNPGFLAVYGEKETSLHLLWVFMGGKMFRITGASDPQSKGALRQSALSLRQLNPEQRAKVRVLRLRLEIAREGESLEQFSRRTGSDFKPEMLAVLNNLDSKPLAQGQLLKIARREPYTPEER